nr:retrovirus-related Pol polyprotein from transposon TNT 1-94 [Tanacetum cinerariifolium]
MAREGSYGSDEMGYRSWDSKGHKKDQVVLEDSLDNLANKSIVTEHGLGSETTQSPCGSSDMRSSKTVGASRIVEDHMKKNLTTEHSLRKEASRLHMYEDPLESPRLPDIAHAVKVVRRFMSNPGREHWEAVKWLIRYLKGTSKATPCFSRKEVVLEGFSDLDYGGCLDSGKSTTSYIFIVDGTTVSWMSRIQKCVTILTTKAEYMAIAEAGKELVWLKNFLEELDKAQTERVLFCDNQSAIHLVKNLVFHG